MASYNKVIIIGNLTRDPELKFLPNGTIVANWGMATNRKWRNRDGEQKDDVCYVDVKAWGKVGETIQKYCHKGDSLLVEGRLTFESWQATDGSKRNKLYITLESFEFMSAQGKQAQPQQQQELALDDDCPF